MIFKKLIAMTLAFLPSLIFNFRYFGLRKGLKFPVLISHHVWLKLLSGKVILPNDVRFGMVKIGFQDVAIFDSKKCRSIWNVAGTVQFGGCCDLGHGTKISVAETGYLNMGVGVRVTAESTFVCRKEITLDDGCLVSWEVLFMDTDFHEIFDGHGQRINEDQAICLGKHVWVGCRSTVLKGVRLANDTIVAAGTVVHKSTEQPNQIIGDSGRVLRQAVTWRI